MKLIKPIPLWVSELISSNVAISEPEWLSGTPYAKDAEVREGDYVYRAKIANTGKQPSLNTNEWGKISAINRLKMFDFKRGREVQTQNPDEIIVLLAPGSFNTSVSLFGLDARAVKVEVVDDGIAVWEKLINLRDDTGIDSFFKWFKYPIVSRSVCVVEDIPYYSSGSLRVTISYPGSVAKCGKLIVGFPWDLGCAMFGTSPAFQDFSGSGRDAFGGLELVGRRKIDLVDYEVRVPVRLEAYVKTKIKDLSSTPAVWIGSKKFEGTVLFGIAKSFKLVISDLVHANYTLRVEDI
jgi:hypothetical protein